MKKEKQKILVINNPMDNLAFYPKFINRIVISRKTKNNLVKYNNGVYPLKKTFLFRIPYIRVKEN